MKIVKDVGSEYPPPPPPQCRAQNEGHAGQSYAETNCCIPCGYHQKHSELKMNISWFLDNLQIALQENEADTFLLIFAELAFPPPISITDSLLRFCNNCHFEPCFLSLSQQQEKVLQTAVFAVVTSWSRQTCRLDLFLCCPRLVNTWCSC